MCWVFVAIVKLTHGYILILFWFLFINDCFCETTCMDMRYFVFVCACAQDLKLFNYSAELMLLHCVSSSNLIVLSHSPQSFSPLSLSLHFHPFFFVSLRPFFFFRNRPPEHPTNLCSCTCMCLFCGINSVYVGVYFAT